MRHTVLFSKKKVLLAMQGRRWLQFHGILFTLLLIVLFTEVPALHILIPDTEPILLTSIAYSAFVGGILAGTLAALAYIGYDAGTFSMPHRLFHYIPMQEKHLILLMLVSLLLAILVGSLRRRNAQLAATAQSERQARMQVDALFEAIADSVYVFNHEGHVLRMNWHARERFQRFGTLASAHLSIHERWQEGSVYDEQGRPLAGEADPLARMLRGEILTPANTSDFGSPTIDGQERWVSLSGAPTHDGMGNINGAIMAVRDVTEQHKMRQKTQESLEALLMLAEEMVTLPACQPASLPVQEEEKDSVVERMERIAQRLVGLIRNVLGCHRVAIMLFDPEMGTSRPLAVIGLSPELERQWKEQRPDYTLHAIMSSAGIVDRVVANEVVVVDFTQPPFRDHPNPFNLRETLMAPMTVGTGVSLVGALVLDHGPMAHNYTPQEQELARAVGKLAGVIVERERLLAEWARARASTLALQASNQQMDEFIGIAGHELRTPLTSIKASIQLAQRQLQRIEQRKDALPDTMCTLLTKAQDLLNRTERQINLQNRLVSDLLDVSRIHVHRLELHPELCNLATVVKETVADECDLAPQRTILLVPPLPGELLVLADGSRLRQVICNYISNALKYSSMDKPVTVSLSRQDNEARVQVRDEGPGLSEGQQARIWERFYRVPGIEVCSGAGVGLGLGLHICKMIVEQQGGQVGVQSTPGHGSIFLFTLPLAQE